MTTTTPDEATSGSSSATLSDLVESIAKNPWASTDESPIKADDLMLYEVVSGLVRSAVSVDMCGDMTEAGIAQWMMNFQSYMGSFNLVFLLRAAKEIDPSLADRLANDLVSINGDGGSYGEFLWEWATHAGIDADGLCDTARAAWWGEARS